MRKTCQARAPRRRHGRAVGLRRAATALGALLLASVQAGCAAPADEAAPEPAAIARETAPEAAGAPFEGAWFTVAAPPGFTPRPSLASETAEGYDSVFFDSPDGRAVFYVCSPQWGREATDVAPDPATEVLLAEETTEEGGESVRRLRIAAQDGTYARLVEIVFSPATGAQWTFGFQYADDAALEDHLGRYESFKASLEQYAD